MKSKRTKATGVTPKVRKMVMERDKRCVVCGSSNFLSVAHVHINRSHGGLGVPENLCVLCAHCHTNLDNGLEKYTAPIKRQILSYMGRLYPGVTVDTLKFKKAIMTIHEEEA
jgi:5-methylcytosine-specific restriction endonuclease McrA